MVRALALGLAVLAMSPIAATAHGPTRQKVIEKVEINAAPDKVWQVIGNFQDMSWHPAVAKVEGTGGNGANATRTITLKSGGTIAEKLDGYDAAKHLYKYEITDVDTKVLPVKNYSSSLSVTGDGGKSTVEWKGAFYRGFMNNDPPPELSDEAAIKAVTGVYRGGLDALKAKLEQAADAPGVKLATALAAVALSLLAAASVRAAAESVSEAFVTDQTDDSLSIVTLADLKVAATVKIGGKPAGIAMSGDGKLAFITAPEGKELVVVDAASRQVMKRLKMGEGPLGIAVNPKTGRVYVADWYKHKIFVVDPQSGATVTEVQVGQSPSGVAVTPDGSTVLSADRDSDAVSFIDTATNTRTGTVGVGTRPFGITIDASGERAYTANVGSDDVSVIDIASRKVIGKMPVGRRPYAVALAGGRGFVTNQYASTVSVFDLATLSVIKTIDVGDHPEGIAASPDGRYVYVACWFDNVLQRIDTAKLKRDGEASVGDGPRAFGLFLR